ncbi:MAG TPA: sigma-70 family RNA polymerase sigma factor [Chloroflexota bacterium]|nr:sigma-70 family RNA polymerase sigma factor [Chloroflexota bacterium]
MATGDPVPVEARIVERAQRGDQVAFATIYNAFQQRIAGYLYRMVQDSEVAADLTQDVFIRAYRAIGQTKPDLNLKAWLFAIATNAALSHHRRRRLIQWLPLDPVVEGTPTAGPEECVTARAELREALAALPREQAACFLLWAREGFTYEEIGSMLGISPGTAKTRSYRARLALARALRTNEEGT